MSTLGKGMDRLFGGGPASFREQLAELKREFGSVSAMARGLGVDRRTIQRWESGKTRSPRSETAEKVGRAHRESTANRRTVPGDADVRIAYTQRKKGGGIRDRSVTGESLKLDDGTMDAARRAYIAHGPEAAAAAFVDGIDDRDYHDMFAEDLTAEGEVADDSQSDPTPAVGSVR